MTKILIPTANLAQGFKLQVKHIESLLDASTLLFRKKKYSESLPLSILALEEITKLRTIRKHNLENNGITNKEWFDLKKGGSHKEKLTKPSLEKQKRLEEMSTSTFDATRLLKQMIGDPLQTITHSKMKQFSSDPSIMGKLDKVKQDCFYLDWEKSKWSSACIKLSKFQLQAMAHVSIEITKWFLNQTILFSRHPEIEINPDSESFKKYREDPLLKKDQHFKKKFMKDEFKRELKLAVKTLEKY